MNRLDRLLLKVKGGYSSWDRPILVYPSRIEGEPNGSRGMELTYKVMKGGKVRTEYLPTIEAAEARIAELSALFGSKPPPVLIDDVVMAEAVRLASDNMH